MSGGRCEARILWTDTALVLRDRSPRPRHRSRSRSPEDRDRRSHDRRRRHKSRDSRSDESSSSSGSDSEDSYDRERRRRKEKKRDKRDGRDKESREERKARKEKKRKEKKEKKKAKKHKSLAVTSQWGTYGIISEADRANKDPEFRAWLVEERTVNPETLPKDKEKKEFLRFIEDFNTATLPSEKYYDMAKYEIKMKMLRTGEVTSQNDDAGYDPMKDLMSHNSSLKRKPAETDTYLNKAELEELRNVQRERSEMAQRKLLGMDISKNLGVRQEAADRLFR
ncbi:hypothetical protein FFLO_01365 [Filobasidium floriforme]|uniref:Uncharacterized protein n=1 Tax=Filobasidium floriforme TaxID=5210 RepID=A0A8K0NSW0_9TREE|nr:hypothetical protein FFLO_01365 [Filobasidium floriforme]